jgi:antitoxin CptB
MLTSHSGPVPTAAREGEALDPRRKAARFRAWHRGTREMDLVMGRFADREIETLPEEELALFERLLDLTEADVFAWITGAVPPPDGIDPAFIARLGTFRGLT